jgi:hypothetical protein
MEESELRVLGEALAAVECDLRSGLRALTEGSCSRAAAILRGLGELTVRNPRTRQEVRARLEGVSLGYEEELLFELSHEDEGERRRKLTLNLTELLAAVVTVQDESQQRHN